MTCRRSVYGEDYLGNHAISASGKECQPWTDDLKEKITKYTLNTNKACRYIKGSISPVCHVGNSTVEECDIKFCGKHQILLIPISWSSP